MENYEHIRVIGKGSFGLVSEIRRKSDGRTLVWKEVNYGHMSEKEKQLIVSEVNILRELKHPHIVRYLDRIIDKHRTKIYIVMEHCEGGDLGQYIKRKKREGSYIEESFIWRVFGHLFFALKECHNPGEGSDRRPILHRDIKPGNVLLDSKFNAKLGDFGLAKELSVESNFAQTNVGTPYYMSPEMVNELQYDERSDIWALGCLLYEMAALTPPFDASNQLALAKKINLGVFPRIPPQYSEDLFQIIRWMLNRQRSKRPRIEDLERLPQFSQRLQMLHKIEFQPPISYAAKMRELKVFEEDLKRQENALQVKEKRLKEFEAELIRREQQLKIKENTINLKTRANTFDRYTSQETSPGYSEGKHISKDRGKYTTTRRSFKRMDSNGNNSPYFSSPTMTSSSDSGCNDPTAFRNTNSSSDSSTNSSDTDSGSNNYPYRRNNPNINQRRLPLQTKTTSPTTNTNKKYTSPLSKYTSNARRAVVGSTNETNNLFEAAQQRALLKYPTPSKLYPS